MGWESVGRRVQADAENKLDVDWNRSCELQQPSSSLAESPGAVAVVVAVFMTFLQELDWPFSGTKSTKEDHCYKLNGKLTGFSVLLNAANF